MPVLPQPASQPVPRANCAIDPAFRAEAATAKVKLLQSRQRPAQPNPARNAPADKDLRWLAQAMAPSDGLTARQNRRPCNAICTRPLSAGHVSRCAIWRTQGHGIDGSAAPPIVPLHESAQSVVPRSTGIDRAPTAAAFFQNGCRSIGGLVSRTTPTQLP